MTTTYDPDLVPSYDAVNGLYAGLKTQNAALAVQLANEQSKESADLSQLTAAQGNITVLTSQLAAAAAQITALTGEVNALELLAPLRSMVDTSASNLGLVPSTTNVLAVGPAWKAADIAAAQKQLPNARILKGARNIGTPAQTACDFFDMEVNLAGGFTTIADAIAACVIWLDQRAAAGYSPGIVYYWKGNEVALLQAIGNRPFIRWVSDHTGAEHQYPGSDITQWTGPDHGSVLDLNTIYNQLLFR